MMVRRTNMSWMTQCAHMVTEIITNVFLCRRCIAVCEKVQGVRCHRRERARIQALISVLHSIWILVIPSCVSCGQCIAVCPTGALCEKDNTEEVFAAIADPEKYRGSSVPHRLSVQRLG